MDLGEYIATYRREHNLSIREFAKLCNLSHVQIIRMETGKNSNGNPFTPSIKSLKAVAKGMGVVIAVNKPQDLPPMGYNTVEKR